MGKKIRKTIDTFVSRRRYVYVILFLLLCLLYFFIFTSPFVKGLPTNEIQKISAITDILLSFCSVIGIAFTLLYAFRQYESEKKHRRISKAADLAKLYADELLDPISVIINTLSDLEIAKEGKSDFVDIFEKIDLDKICEFNENELSSILSDTEILYYKCCVNQNIVMGDGAEKTQLKNVIGETLNRIEYFCIYFNSEIAEDMTVYQSLHQTFFKVIKYTYIYISSQNTSDVDKFYTNIIKTYVRWRGIYIEKNGEIKKEERKLKLAKEKYRRKVSAKTESPNV